MAVKEGGPDPDANSRLRAVIQNAKAVNMPKDNIERAIKRATDKSQGDYKEVLFEGYGPHGIAILIETATDNNNFILLMKGGMFTMYLIKELIFSFSYLQFSHPGGRNRPGRAGTGYDRLRGRGSICG